MTPERDGGGVRGGEVRSGWRILRRPSSPSERGDRERTRKKIRERVRRRGGRRGCFEGARGDPGDAIGSSGVLEARGSPATRPRARRARPDFPGFRPGSGRTGDGRFRPVIRGLVLVLVEDRADARGGRASERLDVLGLDPHHGGGDGVARSERLHGYLPRVVAMDCATPSPRVRQPMRYHREVLSLTVDGERISHNNGCRTGQSVCIFCRSAPTGSRRIIHSGFSRDFLARGFPSALCARRTTTTRRC